MSRLAVPNTLVLFRLFPVFSVSLSRQTGGGFTTFISLWRQWLSQSAPYTNVGSVMTPQEITSQSSNVEIDARKSKDCDCEANKIENTIGNGEPFQRLNILHGEVVSEIQKCVAYLLQISENISNGECILTTNVDLKCVQNQSEEHTCVLQMLLSELESLPLFRVVNESLAILYSQSPHAQLALSKLGFASDGLCSATAKLCKAISQNEHCNLAKRLTHTHFLTMFLLSWPYTKGDNPVLTALSQEVVEKHKGTVLQAECSTLRKQISLLMKLCKDDGQCC